MEDDQLDDLKQFILATVSQTESRLTERIDSVEHDLGGRVDALYGRTDSLSIQIDSLEQKVDDGFAAIAEIFEPVNDKLDNHENRLRVLEQPAV